MSSDMGSVLDPKSRKIQGQNWTNTVTEYEQNNIEEQS